MSLSALTGAVFLFCLRRITRLVGTRPGVCCVRCEASKKNSASLKWVHSVLNDLEFLTFAGTQPVRLALPAMRVRLARALASLPVVHLLVRSFRTGRARQRTDDSRFARIVSEVGVPVVLGGVAGVSVHPREGRSRHTLFVFGRDVTSIYSRKGVAERGLAGEGSLPQWNDVMRLTLRRTRLGRR
jgi:hypothetical protein